MDVAIIPARGGSIGFPRKNIKLLCGRPLISYTIDAALGAGLFAKVWVSTDDREIEEIARREGADVIRHPPELSGPNSPTTPVIAWDLQHLELGGCEIDIVTILRATSPLRTSDDIKSAFATLQGAAGADSLVSMTPSLVSPARLKSVTADGYWENAFPGEGRRPTRRQEFEPLYVRNGAIYMAKRTVISPNTLWGERCLAFEMPPDHGLNINTEFDFHVAELLMQARSHEECYLQHPF